MGLAVLGLLAGIALWGIGVAQAQDLHDDAGLLSAGAERKLAFGLDAYAQDGGAPIAVYTTRSIVRPGASSANEVATELGHAAGASVVVLLDGDARILYVVRTGAADFLSDRDAARLAEEGTRELWSRDVDLAVLYVVDSLIRRGGYTGVSLLDPACCQVAAEPRARLDPSLVPTLLALGAFAIGLALVVWRARQRRPLPR